MKKAQKNIVVEIIPVDQIAVLNPRSRNRKAFRQIADSISKVGLKKPITVSRNKRKNSDFGPLDHQALAVRFSLVRPDERFGRNYGTPFHGGFLPHRFPASPPLFNDVFRRE